MYGHYQNKTIVITGASSGIGKALVMELASIECTLFIGARSVDKLELLKQELTGQPAEVIPFHMDLSEGASLEKAVLELQRHTKHIDVLINNAGISQRGYAAETEFEVVERIMNTNYRGTVLFTSRCNGLLNQAADPQIIVNISVVGEYGFPLRSAYAASKHALKGYFQSYQLEPNVPKISLVFAGGVQTNISKNALNAKGEPNNKAETRIDKGVTAEKTASRILKGSAKYKKNIFIGWREVLLLYISRYSPMLYRKIARNVNAE